VQAIVARTTTATIIITRIALLELMIAVALATAMMTLMMMMMQSRRWHHHHDHDVADVDERVPGRGVWWSSTLRLVLVEHHQRDQHHYHPRTY
jgi:hypothetical protein